MCRFPSPRLSGPGTSYSYPVRRHSIRTRARVEVDGFSGQLVAVLDRIAGMLKECDGDLRDVVKTNAYLKNSTDFGEFNKIYRTYFREGPPARTTIVAEFCADVLVEIEVIAYLPNN